ncbi:hypothetical protein NLG97_g4546 [Lecanicillium saksenae]|uniref:Uncharacterized protein n=1 Tax=Lecanicillium saksenae TaxID=468837 RepID=A0ACC1QVJ3_9HYPO|nr:hypothetical protein NLG97_g4546 [Lecanicillium saksenae]
MATVTATSQNAGILAGTFLSGAMMSLCFVPVPVMLDTATDAKHLAKQWTRLFYRGHRIFPAMALTTGLIHCYTAATTGRWVFALAGAATVSIAPYTWSLMAATNRQLFQLAEESSQPSRLSAADRLATVKDLVVKWAWLHLVRSLLPLAGTMIAACATLT